MKHIDKLAITGTLLKAVKTSCVRTMKGRTYIIKHRLFCWLLLHTYYKIARVLELQVNMEWLKLSVLGSHWTLLPKNQCYFSPQSLPGKFSGIQEHFSLCKLSGLSHCIPLKAIVQLRFLMRQHFFFNLEPLVSTYIAHKIHQNNQPPLRTFSVLIQKNLSSHKCFPMSSQGVSFPLLSFQLGSKNVSKRQYLGIHAFHDPLRVQMNVLN